jgi:DNA-binding SARP family transcriptional activator
MERMGPLQLYDGRREVRFGDWAALQGGRAGWLKVLGVFAYLVHRGRGGATRDEIGATVWDRPVSATSLARTLTTLRQTLAQLISPAFVENALIITPNHCALDTNAYLTDAQIFERLVDIALDTEERDGLAAATPFYALAVRQYTGPYMQDIPAADETYHERRHQLMNDFVITIERLAEHAYTRQHYQDCLALCRRGLEAEPASEDLMLWLLRAWERLKCYGEIEHAYRAYLRTTGIDPHSAEGQADTVVQFYKNSV